MEQSFVLHQGWLRGSQGPDRASGAKQVRWPLTNPQGRRGRTSSRTNASGNERGAAARPGLGYPIRKLGDNFFNGA